MKHFVMLNEIKQFFILTKINSILNYNKTLNSSFR